MKKQPRSWLVFSGLAFEIAIIMYVFLKIGFYLDRIALWGLEVYTLLLSIAAILVIIWLILFQTKNLK